jgi:hypothetical protein
MDPKSPQFKRLKQQLYRRLAKSGFVDIEKQANEETGLLPGLHDVRATRIEFEARRQYYNKASWFLETFDWESLDLGRNAQVLKRRYRKVWALHCEGLKGPEIAKALRLRPQTVWRAIRQLNAILIETKP